MRTTLDIDDDVLTAAKELAQAQKTTAGRVISDLVRQALSGPKDIGAPGPHGLTLENGWYVLPRRGGGFTTNEMVEKLLEEADLEDAGLKSE